MIKIRINSGKIYDVECQNKETNEKFTHKAYAICEEHAVQIVSNYAPHAEILSVTEQSEAVSQHYTSFDEYLSRAKQTCMESSNNVAYMFLNLVGEVGETAEKMAEGITDKAWKKTLAKLSKTLELFGATAKSIRKNPDIIESADIRAAFSRLTYLPEEQKEEISKELGDIMWQLFCLIDTLGMTPENVAFQNLDKLASRQQRGKIDGDGDNR